MKIGFALCHGWSFDARTMHALAENLREYTPFVVCEDLGYYSEPVQPEYDARVAWIAVGHSLGFAHLIQSGAKQWFAAVAIAGFTHFLDRDDRYAALASLRELEETLQKSPLTALRHFQRKCGLRKPTSRQPSTAGLERLLQDLYTLQNLDLTLEDRPYLVLGAQADTVVPPRRIATSFALHPKTQILMHPTATHLLGITETVWCADHIIRFVEQYLVIDEAHPRRNQGNLPSRSRVSIRP